jgi:tRNA A-37 threonylcarbamoyl transferase component Bud32
MEWQEIGDDLRVRHAKLLEALLLDRQTFREKFDCETLKENRLRTVLLVDPPDRPEGTPRWVIKSYRHIRLVDRWRHAVVQSSAAREYHILRRLHEHGFPVPRPLAYGLRHQAGVVVEGLLIMEEIPDARNFHDDVKVLHASGARRELRSLLIRIGHIVRGLHDRGIWHPDLHPGNFLVRGEAEAYLIDLHSCLFPGVMPRFLRVRSVAEMAYLREVLPDSDFRWLLAGYLFTSSTDASPIEQLKQKGVVPQMELVPGSSVLPPGFMARIVEFERPVCRRYARRLRRRLRSRTQRCLMHSTTFTVERSNGLKWYRRRAAPREVLDPHVSRSFEGDAIKIRESGQVVRADLGELGSVIVKYRRYGWRSSLASLCAAHRLKVAWIAAHGLGVRLLPTPEALALVERRTLGCVREAWLFVRECEDAEPLDQFLWHAKTPLGEPINPAERQALARHLGELLRKLHEMGVRPHDLSPQNILVKRDALAGLVEGVSRNAESAPPLAIAFIDLDDMRFRGHVVDAKRMRNLVQVGNLPEGHVSVTDRLRALRAYDGGRHVYYSPARIRALRVALLEEAYRTINRMTRLEYTGLMETIPE